jgi:hypothetical protein
LYTRDYVPASIAVQAQTNTDVNYGGYACLIEATDILTVVTSFAAKYAAVNPTKPDVRMFLKEFLELNLILTNWKGQLPPHFHHATYDNKGYMDHNVTLTHMTHNTTSILLYQSPRALFGVRFCRRGVAPDAAAAMCDHQAGCKGGFDNLQALHVPPTVCGVAALCILPVPGRSGAASLLQLDDGAARPGL